MRTKEVNSDTLRRVKAKVLDVMADPDRCSYHSILLDKELSDRIYTSAEVRKVISKAGFDLIHNSAKGFIIKWDKLDTEANTIEWPCSSKEESEIKEIAAKIRENASKGHFSVTIEGEVDEEDTKILEDLGYVVEGIRCTGNRYISWFKLRDVSGEYNILSARQARSMALQTNEDFIKMIRKYMVGDPLKCNILKDTIEPINICEEIPPLAFRRMLDSGMTIRKNGFTKEPCYTISCPKIVSKAIDKILNDLPKDR